MSLSRLNSLLMRGILTFNFGTDYEGWRKIYNDPKTRELCPSDPATWTPEQVEAVNKAAREEVELADRLMALSKEEFSAEVDRLAKELSKEEQT